MRILIVEDELKVARFVERGLRSEGHSVEAAADAGEARAALAAGAFDLVILDLMLPGVDGITFCHELRARGDTTPILILTARDTVRDRVVGLDSGADDYLTKPFALEELLARVRALLRRPRQVQPTQLRSADLIVDGPSRRVWRGDREIALSAKEYALLAYLMANPDRVLSRPMIEEAVWGFDFDCATNVVDVYVGLLRRKLEAGGEPRLIHTVRNMGYVLRVAERVGCSLPASSAPQRMGGGRVEPGGPVRSASTPALPADDGTGRRIGIVEGRIHSHGRAENTPPVCPPDQKEEWVAPDG